MDGNPSTGSTAVIQNSDTLALDLQTGGRVRCTVGDLKGVGGLMVATRVDGRVLIRIGRGTYIELPRFCVEGAKPKV